MDRVRGEELRNGGTLLFFYYEQAHAPTTTVFLEKKRGDLFLLAALPSVDL